MKKFLSLLLAFAMVMSLAAPGAPVRAYAAEVEESDYVEEFDEFEDVEEPESEEPEAPETEEPAVEETEEPVVEETEEPEVTETEAPEVVETEAAEVEETEDEEEIEAYAEEADHVHDDGMEFYSWNPVECYDGGNWLLDGDFWVADAYISAIVDEQWVLPADMNLCLGHNTLWMDKTAEPFAGEYNLVVPKGVTLNIYGCEDDAEARIVGEHAGFLTVDGGTVNIYGGSVVADGEGKVIVNSGELNLYDGKITSDDSLNGTTSDDCVLEINGGTVNLRGGAVESYSGDADYDTGLPVGGMGVRVNGGKLNITGTSFDTDGSSIAVNAKNAINASGYNGAALSLTLEGDWADGDVIATGDAFEVEGAYVNEDGNLVVGEEEPIPEGHYHDGILFQSWNPVECYDGGSWLLDGDFVVADAYISAIVNEKWTLPADMNLCLGHNTLWMDKPVDPFAGEYDIVVPAGVTLNIYGCENDAEARIVGEHAGFLTVDGGTVNVYGGNIVAEGEGQIIVNSGELNLIGGKITSDDGLNGTTSKDCVLVVNGGTVNISGGTVEATGKDVNFDTQEEVGAAGIRVNGGKLNLSDAPAFNCEGADLEVNAANAVDANGYTGGKLTVKVGENLADGDVVVSHAAEGAFEVEGAYVNEDGNLVVGQLEKAHEHDGVTFDKVLSNDLFTGAETQVELHEGNYILEEDVTISKKLTIYDNVNICLNGHRLIAQYKTSFNVEEGAVVSFYDCGEGALAVDYYQVSGNSKNIRGTLNLNEGVRVEATKYQCFVISGTMNINGAELVTVDGSVGRFGVVQVKDGGTLNMNSGSITSDLYYPIELSGGTANINGGTITSTMYASGWSEKSGAISICGHNVDAYLNIKGGTINSDYVGVIMDYQTLYTPVGHVNITGGEINGKWAVAIGGTSSASAGELNISGGKLTATDAVLRIANAAVTVSGGELTTTGEAEPVIRFITQKVGSVHLTGSPVISGGLEQQIEVFYPKQLDAEGYTGQVLGVGRYVSPTSYQNYTWKVKDVVITHATLDQFNVDLKLEDLGVCENDGNIMVGVAEPPVAAHQHDVKHSFGSTENVSFNALIDENTTTLEFGKHYYLDHDVTIPGTLTYGSDNGKATFICLNGHTLKVGQLVFGDGSKTGGLINLSSCEPGGRLISDNETVVYLNGSHSRGSILYVNDVTIESLYTGNSTHAAIERNPAATISASLELWGKAQVIGGAYGYRGTNITVKDEAVIRSTAPGGYAVRIDTGFCGVEGGEVYGIRSTGGNSGSYGDISISGGKVLRTDANAGPGAIWAEKGSTGYGNLINVTGGEIRSNDYGIFLQPDNDNTSYQRGREYAVAISGGTIHGDIDGIRLVGSNSAPSTVLVEGDAAVTGGENGINVSSASKYLRVGVKGATVTGGQYGVNLANVTATAADQQLRLCGNATVSGGTADVLVAVPGRVSANMPDYKLTNNSNGVGGDYTGEVIDIAPATEGALAAGDIVVTNVTEGTNDEKFSYTEELTLDGANLVVAEGHDHEAAEVTFTWTDDFKATAAVKCACGEVMDTLEASVVSEVTTEPGETTTGVRTYTATVVVGDKTYTDTKTEEIPALGHVHEGITYDKVLTASMTTWEAGNYYLTGDVTMTGPVTVNGKVNLCLNGHTLTPVTASLTAGIHIGTGAALNLTDCTKAGKISGAAQNYSMIRLNGGTLDVADATIEGTGTSTNRLILLDKAGSTLNIHEGALIHGRNGFGTVVSANNGNINMDGGTVDTLSGTPLSKAIGTVNISGGKVDGKIEATAGTLTISGTAYVRSGITATGASSSKTINVNGGEVMGLIDLANGTVNVNGGYVRGIKSGKTAKTYVKGGTVEVGTGHTINVQDGEVWISGGTLKNDNANMANVYLAINKGMLHVSGGVFENPTGDNIFTSTPGKIDAQGYKGAALKTKLDGPFMAGNVIANNVASTDLFELTGKYASYGTELNASNQLILVAPHTHSYTWTVTTPATCTEPGVETGTCTCGDTQTRGIAALGHDWSDWVVTKQPAEGIKGEETRTCSRCGETETRELPALDHVHEDGEKYGTAVDPAVTTWTEGTYFVAEDIDTAKSYTVSGNVKLCLNGHTLNVSSITVPTGATLTVCDCGETGKISGSGQNVINVNGTLNLVSGEVSTVSTSTGSEVGTINAKTTGTVNIKGGSVIGNVHGIAINKTAVVNVTGGTVSYTKDTTSFSVQGSYGIFAQTGEINISGGVVNGVKVRTGATVTVTGGKLVNDRAANNTGALYIDGGKAVVREGAEITSAAYGILTSTATSFDLEISGGSIRGELDGLRLGGDTNYQRPIKISGGTIVGGVNGINVQKLTGTSTLSDGMDITGGTIRGETGYGISMTHQNTDTGYYFVKLAGTPVIEGAKADILTIGEKKVWASVGTEPYTGEEISIDLVAGKTLKNGTVVVQKVTEGVNDSKFTYLVEGKTLELSGTNLVVAEGHVHEAAEVTFTWTDDFKATAAVKCECGVVMDTLEASVTSEVTTEPGESTTGVRTYTATVVVGDKTYTDTKTEEIPALGHVHEDGEKYGTAVDPAVTTWIEGAYFVAEDIDTAKSYTVSGNVKLCLNGHTLNVSSITVPTGATLTVCDCGETGKISGSSQKVVNMTGGTLNLVSGEISTVATGTTGSYGTICFGSSGGAGTVNISGGTVIGTKNAVYAYGNAKINITGGTLVYTKATTSSNTSDSYAVKAENSTSYVNITGGNVMGVHVRASANAVISGGTVTNTVWNETSAKTTISGTANISGEPYGVNAGKGTVKIEGGVINGTEHGVIMNEGCELTISGGDITGGTNGLKCLYTKYPNYTVYGPITVTGGTIKGGKYGADLEKLQATKGYYALYLGGTPVIEGEEADILISAVEQVSAKGAGQNYTGEDLSIALLAGKTLKNGSTVVLDVTEGVNDTKFTYLVEGKTLELKGTNLVVADAVCEHVWGEPSWHVGEDNTATATFTCTKCGESQTVDANVDVEVKEPDCENDGSETVTASVNFNGVDYFMRGETTVIPATGHKYGEPVWTWNDKNEAEAVFTCEHDKTHVETVKAVVTEEVTVEAGCETVGEKTYTATVEFGEETYTDTKVEEIPALGHEYKPEWTWTEEFAGYKVEAAFTCERGDMDEEILLAEVTAEVTVHSEFMTEGEMIYTATVEFNGKTYTNEKVVRTAPLYRLWSPVTGEHLYTRDIEEWNWLGTLGWVQEGIAWITTLEGAPVYRLYHQATGNHLYTKNMQEIADCEQNGWTVDGIVSNCAGEGQGVPIYRLRNTNATVHNYLYTVDQDEIDNLVGSGWVVEGIAWFAAELNK